MAAAAVSLSGGSAFAAPATIPATNIQPATGQATTVYVNQGTTTTTAIKYLLTPANSNAVVLYAYQSGANNTGNITTGVACGAGSTTQVAGPPTVAGSCVVTVNNAAVGGNVVRIFADNDGSGTVTTGDQAFDVNIVVVGPVFTATITPTTASSSTGAAVTYTAKIVDQAGNPRVNAPYAIQVTTTGSAAPTIGGTGVTPGAVVAPTGTAPNQTFTVNANAMTDASGVGTFTVTGNAPGSLLVRVFNDVDGDSVYDAGEASATATQSVVAGGTAGVTTVTATPATASNYVGGTQTINVKLSGANGVAIQGVRPSARITAGPNTGLGTIDYTPSAGITCGLTDSAGNTACTYTSNSTAGTDTVQVFVNQALGTATPGPDAGEPTTTVSRTNVALATFNAANSSTECTENLMSNAGNFQTTTCTVPSDATTELVRVTVRDGSAIPAAVSGVIVTFTVSGGGGNASITNQCITNAAGQCSATVTFAGAATGTYVVQPSVGAVALTPISITAASRAPIKPTVVPTTQAVSFHGSPSVTLKVTDQFGKAVAGAVVTVSVSGRNIVNPTDKVTAADGTAVFTYTDTSANVSAGSIDTITASNPAGSNTATVYYYANAAATTVALDVTGTLGAGQFASGNNNGNVGFNALVAGNGIAVHVTNNGTDLAGKLVTITSSNGGLLASPGDANANVSADGKTLTTRTNTSGVATAGFKSTVSGATLIKATADGIVTSGTLTVAGPDKSMARHIAVFPATDATVGLEAGDLKNLRFLVTDGYGNPVAGVAVDFNNAGAGFFFGGTNSNVGVITNSQGIASVAVTSLTTTYGAATVTATIENGPGTLNGGTQCASPANNPVTGWTAGNCSASAQVQFSKLPSIHGTTYRVGTGTVGIAGYVGPGITVALLENGVQVATTTSSSVKGYYRFNRTITKTTNFSVKAGGLVSGTLKITVKFKAIVTSLTTTAGRVNITIGVYPHVSNIVVHFYRIYGGAYHYVGAARTGSTGFAHFTLKTTKGTTYTVSAVAFAGAGRATSAHAVRHSIKSK